MLQFKGSRALMVPGRINFAQPGSARGHLHRSGKLPGAAKAGFQLLVGPPLKAGTPSSTLGSRGQSFVYFRRGKKTQKQLQVGGQQFQEAWGSLQTDRLWCEYLVKLCWLLWSKLRNDDSLLKLGLKACIPSKGRDVSLRASAGTLRSLLAVNK